jgi:pimeloyl-ACP methyl ester carboxylesterase
LAAGDEAALIATILVGILNMIEDEVDALRSSVRWRAFLANAPTVSREGRVEHGWVYQPGEFDGIAAPTLLLAGSESPPELSEATRLAAAAIPGAQIRVLDGHGHFAHKTDPAMIAAIVRQFIS